MLFKRLNSTAWIQWLRQKIFTKLVLLTQSRSNDNFHQQAEQINLAASAIVSVLKRFPASSSLEFFIEARQHDICVELEFVWEETRSLTDLSTSYSHTNPEKHQIKLWASLLRRPAIQNPIIGRTYCIGY